MSKKPYILLLLIWSLNFLSSISYTNLLLIEHLGSGQLAPVSDSPVYLKSEKISANISDIVEERAEYLLKNTANSTFNLSIALPFSILEMSFNLPSNISLFVNGIEKKYNWSPFDFTDESGHNFSYAAIVFNVTFGPFEEKTIIANYSRQCYVNADLISYVYLTKTSKFWNRSIECAYFNFRIDTTIGQTSIQNLDGYSNYSDGDELVVQKEFYNWSPEENIIITFNTTDLPDPHPKSPTLLFFIIAILLSSVVIIALIVYFHIKKKNTL